MIVRHLNTFVKERHLVARAGAVLLCIALLWACGNNQQPAGYSPVTESAGLLLSESFEGAGKGSYAAGTIELHSGTWYMNDALLAATDNDAKAGRQCVRMRNNGVLGMNFDVAGVSSVTVRQAAYGTDKASGWRLCMSVNGGRSYVQVGANMVAGGSRLQMVSFIVNHNGPVRFRIEKTGGGKNRINIDDFVIYAFNAKTPLPGTDTLPPVDTPVKGDNGNLLLGNPSNATASTRNPDNYLISNPYYTISYNRSRGGPNWVSWYTGSQWLGHTRRTNDFRADDSGLPPGWYHVQSTSYQGSGFERGHNCPSADRTSSTRANSATFLMTNMIPQAPANNQHTWANLENYERLLISQGNEVYVIMGSYGRGGYGTSGYYTAIDSGRIAVPAFIWKVMVVITNGNNDLKRINSSTRIIAVITPNHNGVDADWAKYLYTVRDIENATGYNLLSGLPKAVQDAVETRKDAGYNASDAYSMRL